MSQGDSRTTASIVGLNTVEAPSPRRRPLPAVAAGASGAATPSPPGPGSDCLPPQPKMIRSDSCSAAASTIPSAAWRPIRTSGWIVVPAGA